MLKCLAVSQMKYLSIDAPLYGYIKVKYLYINLAAQFLDTDFNIKYFALTNLTMEKQLTTIEHCFKCSYIEKSE
jgi:hypothetical protein